MAKLSESHFPAISVVMPVYNAETYIHESIKSVLDQTFGDFELLIFDDGSTDKSFEIAHSFDDPRIRVFRTEVNQGYVRHLNHGLLISKGRFIARMDADDISHTERFEKQITFLESNHEVGVCGSWFECIGDHRGTVKHPEDHNAIFTRLSLWGSAIGHPTVMMSNKLLRERKIRYSEKHEPAEDYALWCDIAGVSKLYNIQESLLSYRVHSNNVSNTQKLKQQTAVDLIRRSMIGRLARWNSVKDAEKIDLLFEFLHIGEQAHDYSVEELQIINGFIACVLRNPNIDRGTVRRIVGTKRLFVYENVLSKPWIYSAYRAARRIRNAY